MPPSKPKITLTCENCDKQFQRLPSKLQRKGHKFCSQNCKYEWMSKARSGANNPLYKRNIVPCAQCGTPLERHPKRVADAANQFCDWTCYSQWRVGKLFRETTKIALICDGCGKAFEKSPSLYKKRKKHYCSIECYHEHIDSKVTLTCEQCGKPFERYQPQSNGERNFCSRKCWGAWRSQNESGNKSHNYKSQPIPCAYCGKELLRQPAQIGKRNFCNKKCHGKWISENQRGEKATYWHGGDIQVNCSSCGNVLNRPRNAIKRNEHHFCDKQCHAAWQSANLVGENHPNWKGGLWLNYGPNWDEQRAKARKRDGNKCQHCGITQKKLGKELDVHHIQPFRTFDYVPKVNDNYLQANELSNLLTLCPTCHHKAEWGKIPLHLPMF